MPTVVAVAESIWWGLCSLNILGMLFQIRTNQKISSTKGLSFWMILAYQAASVSLALYANFLFLPRALRVMVPVEAMVITIIVGQEFFFGNAALRRRVMVWHGSMLFIFSLLGLYGIVNPYLVGHFFGWVSVLLLGIYQVPQLYHNWARKSVHGISLASVFCSIFVSIAAMWSSYVLSMPIQSFLHAIRALIKRLILVLQFWVYRKK